MANKYNLVEDIRAKELFVGVVNLENEAPYFVSAAN